MQGAEFDRLFSGFQELALYLCKRGIKINMPVRFLGAVYAG